MKIPDVFCVEKVLSGIYEDCRQNDDFTLERSKLHPFELMSDSQATLSVDGGKNIIKEIYRRFCLVFENVKNW